MTEYPCPYCGYEMKADDAVEELPSGKLVFECNSCYEEFEVFPDDD